LAIHIVAFALLFWSRTDRQPIRPERAITLLEVLSDTDAQEKRLQEAVKPVVDVSTRPAETLFPVQLPIAAVKAVSSGVHGETCPIAAAIQADLLIDEPSRAELGALPLDARSVANAIVLWTGAPEHDKPVLPATDLLILKRLETFPSDCLDIDQTGPDFIYAMVDNRTVSIAIGSGQWRWRTYLDFLSISLRPTSPNERTSHAPEY
jgi:hypothetical protein